MTRTRKVKPRKESKDQGEYRTFEDALKKVLTVPREEMQKRLKDASEARASNDED